MEGVAQLAEHRVVAPEVVGSSPTALPTSIWQFIPECGPGLAGQANGMLLRVVVLNGYSRMLSFAPVAQWIERRTSNP